MNSAAWRLSVKVVMEKLLQYWGMARLTTGRW